MWKYPLTFILIFLSITACVSQPTNSPTSTSTNVPPLGVYFPQLINTPNAYLEALITGELILENGCLRVQEVNGHSILLIWDPRFSTIEEGGVVKVISSAGEVLASVGDFVAVGGGFSDDPTVLGLKEPLPKDCPGSYYLVGETIKKLNERPLLRDVHFPQVGTPIGNVDFLVRGELALENGCLRVSKASLATGNNFSLIWNSNFATRREQGVVQVIDAYTGELLASVGDYVEIGGGKAPADIEKYLKEPIPIECPEPYWLVGETLKKIDYP